MSSNLERSASKPFTIQGTYISSVWNTLLTHLLAYGNVTAPRGKTIKEQLNVTLHVEQPLHNVLVNKERNLGYRAMVAEWLWIAAGTDKLEPLLHHNKNYQQYSDDGVTLYGAYGPRLRAGWNDVIKLLRDDRDSRQGVLSIWAPDTKRDTKDTPCTLSLQFLIRNACLHLVVNMRSSDAWLGLPNDFYVFSQLQNEMACEVDEAVGGLTMNLGSSHLYETNFEAAEKAVNLTTTSLMSPRFRHTWPLEQLYQRFLNQSSEVIIPWRVNSLWNMYVEVLQSRTREDALWLMQKMETTEDE